MPLGALRPGVRLAFRACFTAALAISAALPAAEARAAWRQSEFILGGVYTGDASDPSRFVRFQQAGLNRVVNGDRNDLFDAQRTSFVLDSLRRARKGFDLELFVTYRVGGDDSRIAFNPRARAQRAGLARTLDPAGGINRPVVDGWWVWDEPLTDDDLRQTGDILSLLDSLPSTRDQLGLVTLLPTYASGQPGFDRLHGREKRSAYKAYLRRVASMYTRRRLRQPLWCADHYPFQGTKVRPDYFMNLGMLRDAAMRSGTKSDPVPFWIVVQLAPERLRGTRYRDTPTVAQVKWQVSSALAHGAKGILYWTLVPSGPGEFGPGLLDRRGSPTARYAPMREFNLGIRKLGPVLMRLDPVAVRHPSAGSHEGISAEVLGKSETPASLVRAMTGGSGAGLVGHLRDRSTGEDYLFVVNTGLRASANFTLELTADFAGVERVLGADITPTRVADSGRRFEARNIAPGCGALYRIRRPARSTGS